MGERRGLFYCERPDILSDGFTKTLYDLVVDRTCCTVQDGRDFEDYPLKNRGFGYYGEQEKQIIHRKISDKVDEKWNLF